MFIMQVFYKLFLFYNNILPFFDTDKSLIFVSHGLNKRLKIDL